MSDDQSINTQLSITPDKQAQSHTERALAQVRAEIQKLAQTAVNEDGEINEGVQKRIKALKKLERQYTELEKAAKGAASAERSSAERSSFDAADDFNSQGRRQVGGLGDVDTALSALGATEAGEIFGMAEAVGQLPGAFAAAKAGVTAFLGGVNPLVLAAGAAAGALAFLAINLESAREEAKKLAEQQIAAQEEVSQILRDATFDDASEYRQSLIEERDAKLELADALEAQANATRDQTFSQDEFIGKLQEISGIYPEATGSIEAQVEAVERLRDEADSMNPVIDELTEGLEEGATAARDYANELLESARAAGDRVRVEQQAASASAEQNQQRLEQIAKEDAALREELAVLEASGDTSKEVSERIEELNAQLARLGEESEIVSKYATATEESTAAVEEATQAESKRVDALKRANDQLIKAETQRADRIADANQKARDSLDDAQTRLSRDFSNLGTKFNEAVLDTFIDGFSEQQAAARDHQRALKKIQDDAEKQREDAAAALDFKRLFEIEEGTNDAINAQIEQYNTELREREIAQGEQLQSLRRNLDREKEEKRLSYGRQQDDIKKHLSRMERNVDTAFGRTVRDVEMALRQLEQSGTTTLKGLQQAAQQTTVNNNNRTLNNSPTFNFNGATGVNAREVQQIFESNIEGVFLMPL